MEMKDILKSRRLELNLTLKEVADFVGVSEATLSRWESGKIDNPRRNRIAALAKILNIPPSTIVGTLPEEEITPAPESGLSEARRALLDAVEGMSEEEILHLIDIIAAVKGMRK